MRKIDESYKLDGSASFGLTKDLDDSIGGAVHTPFGTVAVYSYAVSATHAQAVFTMAHRGRLYRIRRTKRGEYSGRGLTIIAGRFAAEVAAQAGRKHAD